MRQIGYIIGELILIIGGFTCFYIYSGYYKPEFKNEKEKIKHEELIRKNGKTFKIIGLLMFIIGVFRLISNSIF